MQTTSIDCDNTVKLLSENELGFLLLQDDGKNPMLDILAKKNNSRRQVIFDSNNQRLTYHLFRLLYGTEYTEGVSKVRNAAVYNLFARWIEAGYNKRHAKSP